METISMILIIAAIVLSMVVVIKILAAPVKLVFKILINAASGFVLLIVANIISGFFDFSLPIDFINCLVSGVFGIPGVAFLIVIKLLF
ncbi:MAG: pro-sigmaK processing inhibitor BofA family protein [Candidatus Limivicinus sp.]|nr:pro-sigmaK processing inhibitor BofA family protein [Clostridiales bacterium]MDY3859146.1 pro-sigmaK processing inhibitor BofA family protein [Candidatus Limivicinus sp.]